MKKLALSAAVAAALAPGLASATNGMNMEGYGPVATAMGGASMAYDNGAAAMMGNPATIGLMGQGSRLDVALGRLSPKITTSMTGQADAASSATSFLMPAMGWVAKRGELAYGVGMFAQGGMGTEYSGSSFMSAGSGLPTRSEVGVMRIMAPIAYSVDRNLTVGGSLDYVRASMDLQMAMGGNQMGDMMPTGTKTFGTLTGQMVNTLGGMMGGAAGQISALNWGYFDFSDNGKFTGKASSAGFAAKVGGVYRVDSKLSVGAAIHSKTALKDMEAASATVSMNVNVNGMGTMTIPVSGKISVTNFQWPQTFAAGVAYQVSDPFTLVADYKRIQWSGVMKNFNMTFVADATQANAMAQGAGLGGKDMQATMFQNWVDQNVFQLGGGYKMSQQFTVRAGLNIANNPVPDFYMNPLFPAIIKNHVTTGVGYAISRESSIDASLVIAPEVSATNGWGTLAGMANGTTKHSQMNMQVMYSQRF